MPCSALEETARYLTEGLSRTWVGIGGTITARRRELDDMLARLADISGRDGLASGRRVPVRTLVVSPCQEARAALARRVGNDPRFALTGEVGSPAEVVPLAAGGLPDLVLVHLPELEGRSLADLAALGEWSPETVVVLVSGLDAGRTADLVLTSEMIGGWSPREPVRTVARGGGGGANEAAGRAPTSLGATPHPPRSIIQEAMRQMGIPMRRPR